ncbi:hypothetical protein [Methanoregula sp.]|uniref:hypothetical protein n=1 Tax=Methanoregula sp. TaxID=2052170 RepID=UPI003564B900
MSEIRIKNAIPTPLNGVINHFYQPVICEIPPFNRMARGRRPLPIVEDKSSCENNME